MERMKLTEKEKEQILKNGAEAMSKIIERMSIEMGELEEENKKLNIKVASLEGEIKGLNYTIEKLREELSAYDREYFDEDKKSSEIYKKQYQHSMGFSDFGGYDEDEHIVKDENTYRDLDL